MFINKEGHDREKRSGTVNTSWFYYPTIFKFYFKSHSVVLWVMPSPAVLAFIYKLVEVPTFPLTISLLN